MSLFSINLIVYTLTKIPCKGVMNANGFLEM